MKLIDPTVAPSHLSLAQSPRLATLDGARIGLYSNWKLNAAELVAAVASELSARHKIAGQLTGHYMASRVMRPDEWGDIDSCDIVLLANGDCGSCSSSGLLNAISLEQRGLAAVLIATDQFRPVLEATKRIGGLATVAWAETPHPVANLTADELRHRAVLIADQVERIVLEPLGWSENEADSSSTISVNYEPDSDERVRAGIDEACQLIRADGGDMRLLSVSEGTVQLELLLQDASCADCVMPRAILERIVLDIVRRNAPEVLRVRIMDPRDDTAAVTSS